MILEIADESVRSMLACLMNAVVYEAGWWEPFLDWNIRDGLFRALDKSAMKVPVLHSQENCYREDSLFTGFAKVSAFMTPSRIMKTSRPSPRHG